MAPVKLRFSLALGALLFCCCIEQCLFVASGIPCTCVAESPLPAFEATEAIATADGSRLRKGIFPQRSMHWHWVFNFACSGSSCVFRASSEFKLVQGLVPEGGGVQEIQVKGAQIRLGACKASATTLSGLSLVSLMH